MKLVMIGIKSDDTQQTARYSVVRSDSISATFMVADGLWNWGNEPFSTLQARDLWTATSFEALIYDRPLRCRHLGFVKAVHSNH